MLYFAGTVLPAIARKLFSHIFNPPFGNAQTPLRQFLMETSTPSHAPSAVPPVPENGDSITFGAGCFWCTEAVFQQLPGVLSVTSGYTGGATVNPTYEQICNGDTGHVEVSRIVFDTTKTNLNELLDAFWQMHDPTTPNRQGNDVGTQYRSAVFYNDDKQRTIIEASKQATAKSLHPPYRDGNPARRNVLPGRKLPSGLLQSQQEPESILRLRHHAEAAKDETRRPDRSFPFYPMPTNVLGGEFRPCCR